MDNKVYDEPSDVNANSGRVAVDGPDGVDVRLTPDAALGTSDRLHEAAVTAQGQKRFGQDSAEPAARSRPKPR